MKAYVIPKPGSSTIEFADVDVPEVSATDLLVKVHAIGVGVHDRYFLPQNTEENYVIGIEAAGMVEQVGADVTSFKPGDKIGFINPLNPKGGTWAAYTVVPVDAQTFDIPDGMSFEQAAALPVAGGTALKALHALGLQSGDSLFVAGGTGAIGSLLVQIGKARGYRVAASASAQNHDLLRNLGAELAVDYTTFDWQSQVKDWAQNGVGGAIAIHPGTAAQMESLVKDGGSIVAVSGDHFSPGRQIELLQIPHHVDVSSELRELARDIASGKVELLIQQVYPFGEALAALEKAETRHSRGKQVIRVVD